MAEYVERKIATNIVGNINTSRICDDKDDIIEQAIGLLDHLPAADVAPVVHGEWIKRCITSVDSPDVSECFICKYPVSTMWGRTNYCPNCGAKMDRERRSE